jgi:hypothetical protein
MRLSAPTTTFFYISVALVVLGLLGKYGGLAAVRQYDFLLVLAGYVVLAIGCVMKNR